MKKLVLLFVFVVCSMVSYAQYATYSDIIKVGKMTRISEVSQYMSPKGWKFQRALKPYIDALGNEERQYYYCRNCTMDAEGVRHWSIGDSWSSLCVYVCTLDNSINNISYTFEPYSVYSSILNAAKANGFKYSKEFTSEEGELYVLYQRNKEEMAFIESNNGDYSIFYYPRGII